MSWLIALCMLGMLVLVHEWGHFFVARRCGVRVLRFSIGFGPKVFGWRRGHTEYHLSCIPLGGYVKMAGEQQGKEKGKPWEYFSKPVGVRALIVLAGPFVNYVVAFLAFWVLITVPGFPHLQASVGEVIEGMPAETAGLREGDHILEIDGHAVGSWNEMAVRIREAAEHPLTLQVERDGRLEILTVTPELGEATDIFGRPIMAGQIGVRPTGDVKYQRAGPVEGLGLAWRKQAELTQQTLMALWMIITQPARMRDNVAGPVGILVITSEAVKQGLASVLFVFGYISLALAIFNVLPVPILDGGHLLFMAIERLRGHPVSLRVQERSAQVSLVLLLTFVVVVSFNDLNRFGLVEKVIDWWRH